MQGQGDGARNPDDDGDVESSNWFAVRVKTIDSLFTLHLAPYSTIGQLRQAIISQRQLQNKNVRIIFKGKILTDDGTTLTGAGLTEGCFIHCAISDFVAREERLAIPEPPILRGLDRLRETGFSDADIEQFRLQFRHSRNLDPNQPSSLVDEEEWMEESVNPTQLSTSNNVANSFVSETRAEGSLKDLFFGLVVGFLLGLITIFWLYDSSLPRRTKYGLIAGLGCNISFGIIRINQT